MDSIPQKRCTKCGAEFPATDEHFPRRKSGTLRADCRICARNKTKEWRELHPTRAKEWRDAHPEYQQAWYSEHKEEHLTRTKERYYANPRAKLDSNQRWRDEHPEQRKLLDRTHAHRRRTRKRNNGGSHTRQDIELQYTSQRGKCWWCGCNLDHKYEVDHVIALSRGGSNSANNLVVSCISCNRSKKAKLPYEWIGRLI